MSINSDSVTDEDSGDGADFTSLKTAEEVKAGNSKENKTKVVKAAKRCRPRKRSTLNSKEEEGVTTTVEEAINGPNSNKWYKAMWMEMQSLNKNSTWTLVYLPLVQKPLKERHD